MSKSMAAPSMNIVQATLIAGNEAASSSSAATASSSSSSSAPWYRVCSLSEIPLGGAKCTDVAGRPLVVFRTNHTKSVMKKVKQEADIATKLAKVDIASSSSAASSAAAAAASSPSSSSSSHSHHLHDGTSLYALDRVCYHMGGPLEVGDIESLGDHLTVTCPWHRYKISLEDGTGLYQVAPGQWKSKGVRQRTHTVRVDPSTQEVSIQLNPDQEEIASDSYCEPQKYAELQVRLRKQQATINASASVTWNTGTNPQQQQQTAGVPGSYMRSGHLFAANREAAANAAAAAAASSSSSASTSSSSAATNTAPK